jgi:hypothetical protein
MKGEEDGKLLSKRLTWRKPEIGWDCARGKARMEEPE